MQNTVYIIHTSAILATAHLFIMAPLGKKPFPKARHDLTKYELIPVSE